MRSEYLLPLIPFDWIRPAGFQALGKRVVTALHFGGNEFFQIKPKRFFNRVPLRISSSARIFYACFLFLNNLIRLICLSLENDYFYFRIFRINPHRLSELLHR